MNEILGRFLNDLELIGVANEELYDSEVRQQIGDTVMDAFVRGIPNYVIPQSFEMFSFEANAAVCRAVCRFVAEANQWASAEKMTGFFDRLAAVQNRSVRSHGGYDYEEFLGHTPPECYDSNGKVVRVH